MMLLTNGRVLVDPAMNETNLDNVMDQLIENARMMLSDENITFTKKLKPFLQYENTSELSYQTIKDVCPADVDIYFRAIGKDDEIQKPFPSYKDIKHHYTPEEKEEIADNMCQLIESREKKEAEKKAIVKRMGDEIKQLDDEIYEDSRKHTQGFEIQNRLCIETINFKEQKKFFVDKDTGDLLKTEDLTPEDQRTLFDIRGYDPENDEEMNMQIIPGLDEGDEFMVDTEGEEKQDFQEVPADQEDKTEYPFSEKDD